MTLKQYLKFMLIATALCWLAFVIIIFTVDPHEATTLQFILFYISLLLSLTGILAIIGLIFRGHLSSESTPKKVSTAFRQAIWFSTLIIFFLFLQGQRILTWWNLIIFLLFLTLLEFFFLSHRNQTNQE